MNKIHFSSSKDDWATPKWLFDRLNEEFNFTCDLFASKENALCPDYITDCFNTKYVSKGWAFGNPPYRAKKPTTGDFVQWAYTYAQPCVLLLPARTDTKMWHDYCMKGEIRFIKGRLHFGGHKDPAPFPSAIIVFPGKKVLTFEQ